MIPTYVTPAETAELQALAAGQTVLELGTQYGHSCIAMAEVAACVVSVDWHLGDPDAGFRDTLLEFASNLRARHGLGSLVPVIGRTAEVLPLLRPASFQGLFHDASHDAQSIAEDLELALPLLKLGAWVAAHDWGLFEVEAGFTPRLGPPRRVVGRLAVWRLWPGR